MHPGSAWTLPTEHDLSTLNINSEITGNYTGGKQVYTLALNKEPSESVLQSDLMI